MRETAICVVVTGLQCAGKTRFLRVSRQQGCATLEWSEVIYDDLGRPGTEDRGQWLRCVAQRVKQKGPGYYPSIVFHRLASAGGAMHVVSGARNPAELGELLGMYANVAVVWVEADATIRFRRSRTRARLDAPASFVEFIRHDHEELSGGLAAIAAQHVTHHVVNNGSNESYSRSISRLLEDLKEGSKGVVGV